MMTLEEMYKLMLEASRRDFLKKLGGAVVGSQFTMRGAASDSSLSIEQLQPIFVDFFSRNYGMGAYAINDKTSYIEYNKFVVDMYKELLHALERSPLKSAKVTSCVRDLVDNDLYMDLAEIGDDVTKMDIYGFAEYLLGDQQTLVDDLMSANALTDETVDIISVENSNLEHLRDDEDYDDEDYDDEDYDDEDYDDNTKDIEYSRMDTGGGSEDEGYAKYYESKMRSYEEFCLEYFKGDPIMNVNFTNGKNPNRISQRKNKNTIAREYKHMHPDVEAVANGVKDNVVLKGPRLQQLLQAYNIQFKPGTKGLGRSYAVLVMSQGNDGQPVGVIKKK